MVKKNIMILGAGFGGVTAALTIARGLGRHADEYEIVLVDRHHHQLYTPALYEIASIPAERASEDILKKSILIPTRDILAGTPVTFLSDEFTEIRKEEKKIILKGRGELSYAFLVFALGSETNYFGIEGLHEHSFALKTCDDALMLRNAIERLAAGKTLARVVVGGAGSSGVEIAAEFVNFFCALERGNAAKKLICTAQITLVEAGPEILPGFDSWTIARARNRLEKLGIAIRTGSRIQSVTRTEIIYQDATREAYDILVWTGGVKGPTILASTGMPLSDHGAFLTDEYLGVNGAKDAIFAIGDNAAVQNPATGRTVVWNVPAAEAEGKTAAKNILALIRGGSKEKFVSQKKYPFVLALGKKYAIADLGPLRTAGFFGWCVKQLVELRYLLRILPLAKAFGIWRLGIKAYTSND